jgi:putative endonuclease
MKEHRYHVYMTMSSSRRALYIGVTSNLERRIAQHKSGAIRGFTSDYNADRLVYWEAYDNVHKAIGREKQLKGWTRRKKDALIRTLNPSFADLSADWGRLVERPAWAVRWEPPQVSGQEEQPQGPSTRSCAGAQSLAQDDSVSGDHNDSGQQKIPGKHNIRRA